MPHVELRPVAVADEAFLERVYASTREQELALVPWSDQQKRAFVRFQFEAQSTDYASNYPDAARDVVLVDEVPAGRLYVDRRPRETRIIEIALLPEFRGRGVGTRLLQGLLAASAAAGSAVTIHVERNNPAQTLYRRLGFNVAADDGGVYLLMEWRPDGSPRAQAKTAS
jgi:ribosomal protein S18 acetylase RimI-like enzyme